MKLWLDDREITVPTDDLDTALKAARDAAQQAGRVIIEAEWDGQSIPDSMLENPPKTPSGKGEIRFTSANPRALVSTTLHEISDVLSKLGILQQETADSLQAGRMDEAFEALGEVFSTWETVRRAVEEGPALLGISVSELNAPATPAGPSEPLVTHIGALTDLLGDTRSALQNEDWSTLADLLADELRVQADRWGVILRSLAEQIDRR
ncbi:MAG: hypothetical protein IBJ18_10300 [Phycisphaerales bacterium]|nr:hypothetical protein [Phycisphaerales bacterium]